MKKKCEEEKEEEEEEKKKKKRRKRKTCSCIRGEALAQRNCRRRLKERRARNDHE